MNIAIPYYVSLANPGIGHGSQKKWYGQEHQQRNGCAKRAISTGAQWIAEDRSLPGHGSETAFVVARS